MDVPAEFGVLIMPSGFLNKDGSLPSAEPRKKKKKLPPPPDFNFGER